MIGTSVQRYEILEELGQGGMSVVYRARDTTLDRIVAVKVLHEHLAKKQENRTRFRREAQAIARLQHDNIVDVYDYSDEDDDQSFIVMEYIPGRNLRDFVDEHDHPPPEVAAMIGVVLADALEHAHDHGVIHRDLKPENVMVADDGRLTLMDFGIAHVIDAETMTQTGSLLGSPAHMAPEIIDGQEVNHRSDIFSLGTVLYWLATGEFPFQGDNAPHLLRQVLQSNYRDPEQVEPRLSRELAGVIERCLAREPGNRFESVDALRRKLRETLELLDDDVEIADQLNKYFNDPADYAEQFETLIVDRLVRRGREAMDAGDVPTAIARFNRVLAYDPDNEAVADELEELHRRNASRSHVAIAIGMVLAVAGVVAYVALSSDTPESTPRLDAARTVVREATSTARHVQQRRATRQLAARRAATVRTETAGWFARTAGRRDGLGIYAHAQQLAADDGGQRSASETTVSAATEPGPEPDPEPTTAKPPETRPPDAGSSEPPPTFEYRFKVLPLAATVFIDGERFTVPEVLNGVSLKMGVHHIRVTSPGCHDFERYFRVHGPRRKRMSIVLEWRNAQIEVLSNRSAVVYLNGDKSQPRRIGPNGRDATLTISFGKADSDRRTSRRRLRLEIRPRDDMQMVRKQTVTLRPGEQTSVNVNFPADRR